MDNNKRTSLLRKNILFSFLIKGWSGFLQLLLVPFTLFCLGQYENGIWMTISSVLLWIDSLDIGLGNGLRNKLSAQIANNEMTKARESVSSTFFMLIFIIVPIALLLILLINILDLYSILNIEREIIGNLDDILMMCVALVCSTFIFKFIGNVYLGLQLPAVNNALVVGGQTLTLLCIIVLKYLSIHSLLLVALSYTLAPLIVYLLSWPVTFEIKYPELRPSLYLFNKHTVKELFTIGLKFFVLQVAGIVLFASSNTMISHFFTPEMVTPYQIAYRYFSFTMMLFTIIAVPYWSATTDAYERKDIEWIKNSMRKLHKILALLALCLIGMIAVSKWVYPIWVGSEVQIPIEMTICMAFYMMIIIYSLCYSYFLNGIGALNLQIICTLTAALIYFPCAYLLSLWMGVTGMLLALCLVNIPGAIVNRLQFNKIINEDAHGIWKK